MSVPTLKPMSVDDYLHTEELSPYKREYVGGYVYPLHGASRAQAGATRAHVRIGLNVTFAVHTSAERLGCQVYASDMKLRIEQTNTFYYPDVMVVCGGDDRPEVTYETAPCLIVEVLSKSTAFIDRHAKYAAYTALPSLQTYLIAEQNSRKVYVYQRQGAVWVSSERVGSGEIELPCVGHTLTLDDMYRGVLPA